VCAAYDDDSGEGDDDDDGDDEGYDDGDDDGDEDNAKSSHSCNALFDGFCVVAIIRESAIGWSSV